MQISKIIVNLTEKDILSIINDFVDIEGLTLDEVNIEDEVIIKGSFKKFIKINFEGKIGEFEINDGKIFGRLSNFKVHKLGIFRIFRSLALRTAFKFLNQNGLAAYKDRIEVDLNKILEKYPFIKININNLEIDKNIIRVEAHNIELDMKSILSKEKNTIKEDTILEESENINDDIESETIKEVDSEEEKQNKELEEVMIALCDDNSKEDFYKIGRDEAKIKLEKKLPENVREYTDYLFIIPDLIALIYRLLKDNRVPMKTKLAVSASVAYIVCPSDMIPSNIPFVGKIDDLAVLFFALNRIAYDVPLNVIVENWSGKNELVLVLKNGLEYVTNFTGAKNIERIYKVVEELSVL